MSKVYVMRSAPVGYGPSMFVLYDDVPRLNAILAPLSTWGGHDKDTGLAKRYEFPSADPTRFDAAVKVVKRLGFAVEDASTDNAKEFWP
jgi:hypothetical protein